MKQQPLQGSELCREVGFPVVWEFPSVADQPVLEISTPRQLLLSWLSRNGRITRNSPASDDDLEVVGLGIVFAGARQRLYGESIEAVGKRYDRVAFNREAATLQETL